MLNKIPIFLTAALLIFSASSICGQSAPGVGKRPVVGLVLSGGAAKGLAHIGVLRVFEEEGIRVDLVTGNSMGALMGGLYALGYTPAEMEEIAVNTDWMDLLSNKFDRRDVSIEKKERMGRYTFDLAVDGFGVRPLSGLLSGRKVHRLLARLTWPENFLDDFGEMPRPFRCLATDIATGEGVILDRGSLADAMRASMAIPGVFAPIEINGRLLVDGMLVRNFPAQDARDMGADIVIGSDVGAEPLDPDKLHSLIDILSQAVVLGDLENRKSQIALCDLLILPDVGDIGSFSFMKAREIIRCGEESARAKIDEIRALAEYLSAWDAEPIDAAVDLERPMPICGIRIDTEDALDTEAVLGFIGIEPPCDVTSVQLERTVDLLYGQGRCSQVRYRFEGSLDCRTLVIELDKDDNDYLYTGIRYDTTWRTSLLFNLSLRDFLIGHSDLQLDMLLGRRLELGSQYAVKIGTKNRAGVRGDVDFLSDWLDVYNADRLVGRMDVYDLRVGLYAEYAFSRFLLWDAGAMSEWCQVSPQIAPRGFEREWTRENMLVSDIWFDTLDRDWFPTSGIRLKLRGEYGDVGNLNDHPFNRAAGNLLARVPLNRRLSAGVRFLYGTSEGEDIPAQYRFFVGGVNSPFMFQDARDVNFYGYDHQELSGEHAFVAGLDLQFKATSLLYFGLHGNVGDAVGSRDELFEEENVVYGAGITGGIATPLGPIEFTASNSRRHDVLVYFSGGFRF